MSRVDKTVCECVSRHVCDLELVERSRKYADVVPVAIWKVFIGSRFQGGYLPWVAPVSMTLFHGCGLWCYVGGKLIN